MQSSLYIVEYESQLHRNKADSQLFVLATEELQKHHYPERVCDEKMQFLNQVLTPLYTQVRAKDCSHESKLLPTQQLHDMLLLRNED